MKLTPIVTATLLTAALAGCADSGAAGPTQPPVPPAATGSLAPIVVDGIVVNQLDVLKGADAAAVARELAALGGVVLSRDDRLGTLLVWFPTRSAAEITAVKDELGRRQISANLVFHS
ncbi:hypothetical protein [Dactylosporangium sp. CA-139066]|uniref:hypothetical protein n=1 Tax=Dactylosporangium sp. CA-139066 TaxID=3239930 RepID=UPI003D8C1BAB